MTDPDRLRRTYLRLIWTYPRWFRRERGLELVTTLLDDAAPGQQRPSRADALNLIGRGLRARLMPPRRIAAWAVSLLAALFVALAAASAAVLVSPYPGPPAKAPAIAVATIAMHRQPDEVFSDHQEPMRIDNVVLNYYSVPADRAPAVLAQARDQLAAAGWKVGPLRTDGALWFTATTDQLNISVFSSPGQPHVHVYVSKRPSAVTAVGVAAAGLAGLLGGWMMGVSATHRHRHHRPARRRQISAVALPCLLSAPLLITMTLLFAAIDAADGIDPADIQAPLVFIANPLGMFLTAVSVFFGLAALSLTAPTRPSPTDPPYPAVHSLT
jgi:hypothetical protein